MVLILARESLDGALSYIAELVVVLPSDVAHEFLREVAKLPRYSPWRPTPAVVAQRVKVPAIERFQGRAHAIGVYRVIQPATTHLVITLLQVALHPRDAPALNLARNVAERVLARAE